MSNMDALNSYYRKSQRSADRVALERHVKAFVDANLSAKTSPNLQTKACDECSGTLPT